MLAFIPFIPLIAGIAAVGAIAKVIADSGSSSSSSGSYDDGAARCAAEEAKRREDAVRETRRREAMAEAREDLCRVEGQWKVHIDAAKGSVAQGQCELDALRGLAKDLENLCK